MSKKRFKGKSNSLEWDKSLMKQGGQIPQIGPYRPPVGPLPPPYDPPPPWFNQQAQTRAGHGSYFCDKLNDPPPGGLSPYGEFDFEHFLEIIRDLYDDIDFPEVPWEDDDDGGGGHPITPTEPTKPDPTPRDNTNVVIPPYIT